MSRFLTVVIGLGTVFIATFSAGCVAVVFAAGAAAGVSGAVWYHGEVRTSLAGTLTQVRDASDAALQKMGKVVGTEGAGPLECTLTSYADDGRKITILLKSLSTNVTQIRIRVGFWGDQALSRVILGRINERLGNPAAITLPGAAARAIT